MTGRESLVELGKDSLCGWLWLWLYDTDRMEPTCVCRRLCTRGWYGLVYTIPINDYSFIFCPISWRIKQWQRV